MGSRILPAAAGFLVAALLLGGGVALLIGGDGVGSERRAPIPAIVSAPQEWRGRTVLVSGRIVAVYTRAFTVGTPDAQLLVVLGDDHRPQPFGPEDIGARLRLRGEVERFGEQVEIAPGGGRPRAGDAVLRARALQRLIPEP